MRSRRHARRRKNSKQKTFKFEKDEKVSIVKGLMSQSAAHKLLRRYEIKHFYKLNTINKSISSVGNNISNLKQSLIDYTKKRNTFRIVMDYLMVFLKIKTSMDIQELDIKSKGTELEKQKTSKRIFEMNNPTLQGFKMCY